MSLCSGIAMFNHHHNDYLGTGDCMVVRYEQRALELVLVPVWVTEEGGPEGKQQTPS
jgi:hypothetical protein